MSKLLSVAIIEDQENNYNLIQLMLDRFGVPYQILKWAKVISEALEIFESDDFDVIFCDIQLRDGSIFKAIDQLENKILQSPLVFVSAYGTFENALRAIRLSCLNFISKPIDYKEFETTMIQIQSKSYEKNDDQLNVLLNLIKSGTKKPEQFGVLLAKGIVKFVKTDQLVYITASQHLSKIVLTNGTCLTSMKNLGHFLSLLKEHLVLFQIHKSILINTQQIDHVDYKNRLVTMINGEELQVSRRQLPILKQRLSL